MAIVTNANQYKHAGKGPVDAKSLVKTYAELLNPETWAVKIGNKTSAAAYNGMIVAVWLNKDDPSKNGIYFLHDSQVTSALGNPDVTNEANWHKFGNIEDLPDFASQIVALQADLNDLKTRVDKLEDDMQIQIIDGGRATVEGPLLNTSF